MRSVVVTGVSTGIGLATAKLLVREGFRVFGSVRNGADAERVQKELGESFTPLLFDVTDEPAVKKAAGDVRAALGGETLTGLVNNAGIAIWEPILEVPLEHFRQQIEVNLVGPVIVTQAFGPLLGVDSSLKGPPGRIVMMSSVAGQRALPFSGPYAASKFGLEGVSESLRRELMIFGIDVIVIGPGPIRTPIWEKGEETDYERFSNTAYYGAIKNLQELMRRMSQNGLPPEDVAQIVLHALTASRPWVRYSITPRQGMRTLMSWLPKRMQDRMIAKRLGLMPRR
jgi:NAD(P)-dependent dehydrogenase (short-subunit alcohol dehydrogenase family)